MCVMLAAEMELTRTYMYVTLTTQTTSMSGTANYTACGSKQEEKQLKLAQKIAVLKEKSHLSTVDMT